MLTFWRIMCVKLRLMDLFWSSSVGGTDTTRTMCYHSGPGCHLSCGQSVTRVPATPVQNLLFQTRFAQLRITFMSQSAVVSLRQAFGERGLVQTELSLQHTVSKRYSYMSNMKWQKAVPCRPLRTRTPHNL